ncbi:YxeA family protein [Bacillus cereus]|uniref:YxeA family protein n=1 Tax=Bacillus cereus TaxID=1396 RepID=UPI000B4BDA8A|nr:YxeA family protein [Bacillus cereus]MDA2700455.1 YxeA family protein [Bacillus cereus]MDA2706035.1 YxeA family protein [Bacillus cereus]MDZ4479168.1 YxeA family protein [Bacillus cereus]MDZ4494940.1 YxeA family protein [Bacillus cereus]MDZ4517639.1 YxeA family protein [Bacillus cereus]
MKKFVICILGIGLPIYLLPFILRGDLDRFNPIAEEKNVYAVAKGYGVPDYHQKGKAMYSLKAVDELSNEKEYNVGTNTPNDFIRKTYLKLHVKGKYVYSYDIISKEDIPKKIRGPLEIANK